jgi:uncharacterized protein (DUF58 family)
LKFKVREILIFPYRAVHWMMMTRPIRFTRFGTFYVLFSLGVGAAAINTGNNLLYLILGILLGLIIISGFLSDSALWGTAAKWSPLGSLYAGEKGLMECSLQKGWFPGIALTVESNWTGLPSTMSFVPWIPAHGNVFFRTEITPGRRGHLTLVGCRFSTRFPFGFFQKSHTAKHPHEWVVYPRIRRLPSSFWEQQGENYSRIASNRKGLGSVPFLLRDYREGDPLRQVDWKRSAKRAHLMVKEMEEDTDEGDLFYLEAWPEFTTTTETENFISFIASLLFSVYELGRPVGLIVPGHSFPPEASRPHLHRLFEYLALVDPSEDQHLQLPRYSIGRPMQNHDLLTLWRTHGR